MKKILIVDDDADIRDAVSTVLAGGYELKEADSKESARAALASFRPDLIILDVMMETMSAGFDLAREIKRQGAHPKILMLTSVDKQANIDFSSETGDADWLPIDGYLAKPVVPSALAQKVKSLLG